ncbi:beta-ketoacyl synthase chain length factor [Leptothrix discophora]|uniref:Beta-ketoacyl synthase chain length factor n=1 Tax=Leptothrix discophora TaxID=89 RepID=A0ABT9G937_LEPDI|nr:beta-ketoacyl synthase chain length factor [Leptothrix discophora]MDP4302910.1 beta-ketoacyl synthase chain length factor [Leptothrix discophora]
MSAALSLSVRAVALVGPGLADWTAAQPVLTGAQPWVHAPTVLGAPQRLPPAERRRAGAAVKVALVVAEQVVQAGAVDPATLASVYTSSNGDGANCHALCEALAQPQRLVSPTRFTNSVHNAPAGYWHIAVAGREASTSLCAHDGSFVAGLVEAIGLVRARRQPILLVASDSPYPEPLQAARPMADVVGVALILSPEPADDDLARLAVELLPAGSVAEMPCHDVGLEGLRTQVPAARALPLLEAISRGQPAEVCLSWPAGPALRIRVGT